MGKKIFMLVLQVFMVYSIYAQTDLDTTLLKLNFPLFDLPYQIDTIDTFGYGFFDSYTSPSMAQSMAFTVDLYSFMHFGMRKLYDSLGLAPVWKNAIYYGGAAAGLLAFAYVLPFGYPWMQQEFTRSILSRFDINSFNGTYSIVNRGPITGIDDYHLAYLKEKAPYDFIRMYEASTEGYILFSDTILRKIFFYDLEDLSNVTAFLAAFLAAGHTGVGVSANYNLYDIDGEIKKFYESDGGQKSRDIGGRYAINWTYDLFHPDEPFSDRGIHPSGDGIARYITLSQLAEDEKQYLVKQGWLGYLNFVSPMLYGFNAFPLGNDGLEGNFALRRYLTSFGTDILAQIFLKKAPFNMLFTYHSYMNYEHYFPAIEAELADFPLQFTPKFGLLLSPRILLGMQPRDQVFMTGEPEFLGLLGLRVDFDVSKHVFPYLDLSFKTDGWVAGNEYLESNVSFKIGVSLRF
jgi:hypothetical protein